MLQNLKPKHILWWNIYIYFFLFYCHSVNLKCSLFSSMSGEQTTTQTETQQPASGANDFSVIKVREFNGATFGIAFKLAAHWTRLPATFYIEFRLAAHWTRLLCLLWVNREHWIMPRWWLNYVLVDRETRLYSNYYTT